MTTASDMEYLLSKLTQIQKQLGGPTDALQEKRDKDEFNAIKLKLAETINEVSKKQDERDTAFDKNGRNIGVIRLGVEIQDGFTELDVQLNQMKEALRRQRKNPKKFSESDIQVKEQQLEKYTSLVNQLKAREEGDTFESERPITLTELKFNLTGVVKKTNRVDVDRQLNEIERDALRQFKKNDEELDVIVDQVNVGLDGLKVKAENMGEYIEKQQGDIAGLEVEVNKAHEGIITANARLKKVLYQYRRPSKFCLDVILILLLLGLIAVVIKLSTSL